ncbi:NirD/YgiW/YdeI family stress tolerance protein [Oceanimonas baumannii]|uniref:YgiW/YdeI family stress tolerance OB fold protein n=1 Tax=Oceanimonas baumannii TaxID=129578 RepID=UPI001D196C0B|nr:NirD/YgiW/YdeI family stress tolerance protein [Oceanimonas baumannii]MCC4263567.1 NirD/YgiW/YdeI family stress tolerance protein [Oceanimonas baumannii]
MRYCTLAGLTGLLWLSALPAQAHDDDYHHRHEADYRGEYRRDHLPITTVAEARHLADDSRIILSGRIVRQLDDDEFLFSDGTGTIKIEMDDDDGRDLRRHRRGRILIWAEVDRDDDHTELEVERVRPA